MSYIPMQTRGGTAAQWTTANPVLRDREEGIETDTGQRKVGDGVSPWTSLKYWTGTQEFVVSSATTTWGPFPHNFRTRPNVRCVDSSGVEFWPDSVSHVPAGTVTAHLAAADSGVLICS